MPRLNLPLALPFALFLASALWGVLIAFAPQPAWVDFFLILVGAALFAVIVWKRNDDRFLTGLVAFFSFVSAVLVVAFVAAHDFTERPIKFAALNQIGLFLHQIFPPLAVSFIQPNNLAGMLAVTLPLDLALAVHLAQTQRWYKAIGAITLALILIFGLILSGSRGAWIGLIIVGVFFAIGYAFQKIPLPQFLSQKERGRILIPLVLIVLFGVTLVAILLQDALPKLLSSGESIIGVRGNEIPRLVLYQQVWRLIQDYFFTGSGLATFPMVYATYALQEHVFILPHAHNILLQIWMEQGLIGIIAFVWLVISFYWWTWKQRTEWNWLAVGGLAATTVMLLHGLVDAAFWYTDWTRPLLLIPFALTLAGIHSAYSFKQDLKIGAVLGAAALSLIIVFWKPALTRWYANLGSLSQTRIELSQYAFPQTLVEYVRHDADLSDAEKFFHETLELDSEDVTANQRLAMIQLARGQYDNALALAQAAYARDATNPVTWQFLGDAYLALGDQDKAYAYWSQVDGAASKLNLEAAIRYDRVGDQERAQWARALAKRIE